MYCVKHDLCSYCNAILILKATCGVAERVIERLRYEVSPGSEAEQLAIETIGRLRADVARVDGRTE